jgi:GTP-binding protein HflX
VADADLIVHVVDGAHPDPEQQVRAVRDVLAEVGAERLPELLVVNKIDSVDATRIAELRQLLPGAVFVSARSGDGIRSLREIIAERLPRPDVFVDALVPYTRGELVARVHAEGELVDEEHTAEGTRVRAKVRTELAKALQPFVASA